MEKSLPKYQYTAVKNAKMIPTQWNRYRGTDHWFVVISKEVGQNQIPVALICSAFSQFLFIEATSTPALEILTNPEERIHCNNGHDQI